MRYMQHAGDYEVKDRRRLLVRAARLGRDFRFPALGAFAAAALGTAARLAGPMTVKVGFDRGVAEGDKSVVTIAAIVFIVLLLIQYVFTKVSRYGIAWVGERYLLKLRGVVFGHLVRSDTAFFSRSKSGVLVSRMTSDIESLQEFAGDGAVMALSNILTVVGVAVAMVLVDWRMATAAFVVIAVLIGVSVVFQKHASKAYEQVRERIGRVLAGLQEGIAGVRVVQAFTQEQVQATSFGRVNEAHYRANMRAGAAISWYFPAVGLLRVSAIAAVLVIGGLRVIDGSLTFGTLVVFLLYLDWFFQPIVNLANVYNLLQAAIAAIAKLFDLLDVEAEVTERPGAYDLPVPVSGDVALSGVTFGYSDDVTVLHDVDLQIPAGQRLAVVGETGAGKSTIAKLVLRFYDPQEGTVEIDGSSLRDVTTDSRTDAVALIPQDGFLFSGTLRDNLTYGAPGATEDDVWNVLRAMGVDGWIRTLPDGLDTEVRERGSRFSAGERQLIALGRAFLNDPSIIVLDEATSNLDPETELEVEGALRVLLAGRTAIVIAHRLRSAERADRVIMIDDGRIIADGRHEELVGSSPEYGRLVEVWERGVT
ncbi:MAG: ABC transporter ATP-binding protein [Actinomycetota bacterium]